MKFQSKSDLDNFILRKKSAVELDLSQTSVFSVKREDGVGSAGYLSLGEIEFPIRIKFLTWLKKIRICGNELGIFPIELLDMNTLEYLDISNNYISQIPREISNLKRLKYLNIGNNSIHNLPSEIYDIVSLEVLILNNNRITYLDDRIGELTKLKQLTIPDNQLTTLPHSIGELTNLVSLDISNNVIYTLPSEIGKLKKLQWFNLVNNSLSIPIEIQTRIENPQAIITYYTSILQQKRKPVNEVKILIVGQGSVGKTSLVRRLIWDKFNERETKTEGISIIRWKVDSKANIDSSNPAIRLNIWDFGGQEIMHATHQFFLTKRSLYLLVVDSRLTQEENRVEYWLKIIQSFGGESPVLIVGNKIDQHPLDIDRTGLQKKYPNIIGILETSAASGGGVEELKATITEHVNNLQHVRDLLPETWFKVKNKLEGLGRETNFITYDRYIDLCNENDVSDETSQRTLIGFLHDLGVVLHFQDDPRLEALGILNPQWVTNGVYKILNSHILFHNKGVLERGMLDEILNFPEYPVNKHLFIVDMMRKFELCYDIEPDKNFLVPDLLPKDEPFTGEWDSTLAFQYHYNVLPSSIISRFIVRMNVYIYRTVWRSGVVLKKGGNTALVKADTEDKKIFIWVTGDEPTRRDFLSAIRAEFDAIHKTIIKIDAREKVPIPGQDKVVIDFEHLLKLERKDITEFIPEGMDEPVSVRQLLNGVGREFASLNDGKSVNINIHGNVDRTTIITGDKNEIR